MLEISESGGATGVCAGCLWHSLCATSATEATCAHGGRQSECVQVPDRASGCPQAWPVVRGLVHAGATGALVDRPPVSSVHRQAVSVGGGDSGELHSNSEELTAAQRATGGVPAWFVWLAFAARLLSSFFAVFGLVCAVALLQVFYDS